MATSLKNKDIINTKELSVEEINLIMETAAKYERIMDEGGRLLNMAGKVLCTFFYEPSTRTRLSFETAMLRLGGQVVSVAAATTSSSAKKGETVFDTGKMVQAYSDIAVIRHPVVGSAQELADGSDVPVINGGDGAGQHPTQSLLDMYTILKEKGKIEGLTIALAGDLRNGRTVHSLSLLLSRFGVKFYFVSPKALAMPSEITDELRANDVDITETEDMLDAVPNCDVLYMTRIQGERFDDPAEYEKYCNAYIVTMNTVQAAKEGMIVMHPLPRVNEIAVDVDMYGGAAYFRQAANGVPVRMALLTLVTGQE
ncbi:MAG: aspartate carbamoyltransferase [Anaerolineaceae bacterium]|nr:aspartate carbamoyltransferase [Anaerolineaceae bacterium]